MFKQIINILVVSLVVVSVSRMPQVSAEPEKLQILATTLPLALFARNLLSGVAQVEVDLLAEPQYGCIHDYALKPKDLKRLQNASLVILNGGGMEEGALAELLSQLPVAKRFVAIDVLATTDVANHDEHFFTDPRLALQVVIAMGKKFSEQFYRKLSQQNLSLLNKNVDRYKMNLQKIIDRQETIRQRIVRLPNRAAVTLSETLQQFLLSCGFDLKVLFWESEFHQPTTHQVLEAPKKIKELKVTFLFLEFGVESKYSQTLLAMHPMHLVTIDPMVRGPSDFSLDYYEQTMNKNFQAVESAIQLEVMRKL